VLLAALSRYGSVPRAIDALGVAQRASGKLADARQSFKRAQDAGATVVMPATDMFWGDRYGLVTDPFGHRWSIATHKKDLTVPEIQAAMLTQSNAPRKVTYVKVLNERLGSLVDIDPYVQNQWVALGSDGRVIAVDPATGDFAQTVGVIVKCAQKRRRKVGGKGHGVMVTNTGIARHARFLVSRNML